MSKKTAALLLAIVLVIGGAIGGTIAWLTDETEAVVNTFTVGNVDIELDETTTDYKMVPGNEIAKDPTITVAAGSEECWLFVKVEKSDNLDNYIDWDITDDADGDGVADGADGWTALVVDGEVVSGVYWREAEAGDSFSILDGNKVTVWERVTKSDMDAFDTDKDGSISEDEAKALPTLTFTAYAVQKAKVGSAADAWDILFPES